MGLSCYDTSDKKGRFVKNPKRQKRFSSQNIPSNEYTPSSRDEPKPNLPCPTPPGPGQDSNIQDQTNKKLEKQTNEKPEEQTNEKPEKQTNKKPNIPPTEPPLKPQKYDAIVKCESIKKLKKGWEFITSKKYIKRMNIKEQELRKFCTVCMCGESNKGKTFILNKLLNNNLPSGYPIKTDALSLVFSDFKNYSNDLNSEKDEEIKPYKFLAFDTAGRSEPLLRKLEDNENTKETKTGKELTKKDASVLKNFVESENRDLKISEDFLKNLLITYSSIIIYAVTQLSLSDQIFLYELKNNEQLKYEELFIIHNLFNYETREDLEEYINNTLFTQFILIYQKHILMWKMKVKIL